MCHSANHHSTVCCMCARDQKQKLKFISSWLLLAALLSAFSPQPALASDNQQSKEPPAAMEQPATAKATSPRFPERITTLDGRTYDKTTLERVDPDGLLV